MKKKGSFCCSFVPSCFLIKAFKQKTQKAFHEKLSKNLFAFDDNKMLMNFLFILFCSSFCALTGCILAELYTGYPLFPGENEVEQLACIMELLGTPPDDLINQATRRRLFFGEFINFKLQSRC